MGRLAESVHHEIINFESSASSQADRYKMAYLAERDKLQQVCDTYNKLGHELGILRREKALYKDLEIQSQRLNEDLIAYEARYRELDKLKTQVEESNKELEGINAELAEAIIGLKSQVMLWEAKFRGVSHQPLYGDEEKTGASLIPSSSNGVVTNQVRCQGLSDISNTGIAYSGRILNLSRGREILESAGI